MSVGTTCKCKMCGKVSWYILDDAMSGSDDYDNDFMPTVLCHACWQIIVKLAKDCIVAKKYVDLDIAIKEYQVIFKGEKTMNPQTHYRQQRQTHGCLIVLWFAVATVFAVLYMAANGWR